MFKEWEDYVKIFKEFLVATGVVGASTCHARGCRDTMPSMQQIQKHASPSRGSRGLFIHVGQIADTDNWEHNFSRNEKTAKIEAYREKNS